MVGATYEIPDVWQRCYEDSWDGFIVPEAFAHPAKFARGLISRIYLEMLAAGMLEAGDSVADPFGGIAGGGIIAAGLGLQWYGCELEEKFWKLGNQNIEMHRALWEQFGDPVPVLVNGDSRKLRANLAGVIPSAIVCSPPFAATQSGGGLAKPDAVYLDGTKIGTNCGYQNQAFSDGNLASMTPGEVSAVVSSPPYSESVGTPLLGSVNKDDWGKEGKSITTRRGLTGEYGVTPGQIGNLPAGTVDSVVSSPPYAESLKGDNTAKETAAESQAKRLTPGGSLGQSCRHAGYGGPGNLGNLPGGEVDAVVSSPPYEGSFDGGTAEGIEATHKRMRANGHSEKSIAKITAGSHTAGLGYGAAAGQLGNESGETFWHAARDIVQECHAILKPGGYAAFVVKAFVRNKSIVDFPGDWRKLCEACGFECAKEVRAMLVKEQRHPDLFGGEDHVKTTARKSFFRRLYESKYPENSIDWEIVQFFRRPQ